MNINIIDKDTIVVDGNRFKRVEEEIYNLGPLEVSVVDMPEFDALIDHIYEEGTSGEAVIHLANKLVRAAIEADRKRISNNIDKRIEDAMRLSTMNHDDYYGGLADGYFIADRIVKGETK